MVTATASPRTILITGATGAIGGALAELYAEPETTLFLQGRDSLQLEKVAARCIARGARVHPKTLDIRHRQELVAWLHQTCEQRPVDLMIAAAGLNCNIGTQGEGESWEETEALIEVNVLAVMAMVQTMLPYLRARRQGQIALFSSLAAYFGLPITPSYCASKAAIKVYGESLRGWLAPEGIRVNVIMPGYVLSRMCREMPGPKPFLWTAARAARLIRQGLERDQARISFPFPLNVGTWWLAVLPPQVSERIVRLLGYRV
jgi:short-subunit dehydrogenase